MQIKKEPKRNYIFIVGSGRCGSTALARILGKHQSLSYVPELFFFAYAMADRKNYEPFTSDSLKSFFLNRTLDKVLKFNRDLEYKREDLIERLNKIVSKGELINYSKKEIYKSIFDFLIDNFQNNPSENVVIQNPDNLFFLDLIKEILEKVKVIGMIRDPRNYFASALKRDLKWANNEETIIALWNISAKYLEKLKLSRTYDFILVKQEELLVKPKIVFKKLSNFLSVDLNCLNDDAIEYINSSFPPFSSVKDVLSRYRILSKDQLDKIEYLCMPYMKKFQYNDLSPITSSLLKKINWKLAYLFRYLVLRLDSYIRGMGRIFILFRLKKKFIIRNVNNLK